MCESNFAKNLAGSFNDRTWVFEARYECLTHSPATKFLLRGSSMEERQALTLKTLDRYQPSQPNGVVGESGRPCRTVTAEIADSNSAGAAKFRGEAHVEERRSPKPKVARSNRVTPAMNGVCCE